MKPIGLLKLHLLYPSHHASSDWAYAWAQVIILGKLYMVVKLVNFARESLQESIDEWTSSETLGAMRGSSSSGEWMIGKLHVWVAVENLIFA